MVKWWLSTGQCRSHTHYNYNKTKSILSREFCSIELEQSVVITGGIDSPKLVQVYDTTGWLMDLPSLLQGRHNHGCGHYVNSGNKQVCLSSFNSIPQ